MSTRGPADSPATIAAESQLGRRDAGAVAVLIALVLPLYLATMYPDVLGSGDSAKFQYLGSVLGTAHPPGYPFYVLLTYVFSFVPLGNLAWRMNFLSVLAGVLTTLCTYLSSRQLGCGPVQACLVALGLATGLVFWNKALAAEVYTVGALLLMVAMWRVLAWRQTRRDRDLLLAVGSLSLGLGNHLTIAVVAPAFVLYALLTDARRTLRPRLLLLAAVFILLGFAQYGYIVLRTWQGTPHLEAQALSIRELLAVIRAEKYEDAMFQYGWHELITERLPLLWRQLRADLHPIGALVVLGGLITGIWRSPREVVLVGGSAAAILALTANVHADTAGFATAAIPPLWLLACFAPGMRSPLAVRRRASVAWLVSLVLVAAVVSSARANFRVADHSDRTLERRLWTAVFQAVPDRTAIVAESYVHDQVLRYMLVGEGVGHERGIEILPRDARAIDAAFSQGRTVIAFKDGARALRLQGFQFQRLPLMDSPIQDLVGSSRRNRFVILAVQPEGAALLATAAPGLIRRFGGTWQPGRDAVRYAMVGIPRGGRGAVETHDAGPVHLRLPQGLRVGGSGLPRPVDVRVTADGIVVQVGEDEPLRTTAPWASAVLGEQGQLRGWYLPASGWTLRPPLEAVEAYTLTSSIRCEDIGDRTWHDVSHVATRELLLHVNNYRAYDARAVAYVASSGPPGPRIVATRGPAPLHFRVERLDGAQRALRMAADRLANDAVQRAPHVARLELTVNDGGDEATQVVDLGVEPLAVWALGEADRLAGPRVRACRQTSRTGGMPAHRPQ
jgi:hypothetical protein